MNKVELFDNPLGLSLYKQGKSSEYLTVKDFQVSESPNEQYLMKIRVKLVDTMIIHHRSVQTIITMVAEVYGVKDLLISIFGIMFSTFYTPKSMEAYLLKHLNPVEQYITKSFTGVKH